MKRTLFISIPCIIFLAMMFAAGSMLAQDSTSKEAMTATNDNWNFLLEPYIVFPNISGKTAIATFPEVEVDADPGDVFENLDMGAMLYFEATHGNWAFSSDLLYMSLKQDIKRGPVLQNGDVKAKQLAWELAALRTVLPMVEIGAGLRLNSMEVGLDLVHTTSGGAAVNINTSATETWVDPILIVRVNSPSESRFTYQVRGDIGGFGVGSDFSWQIQAYAGYRFSKLFQLTGGYRIIGMDYDKGSGRDRFMYNMDTFGPVIRFGFNF